MKSDRELFEVIAGTMESMCGDVLDVPTRDYFGDDMLGDDKLTADEFERLAVIKEHVEMKAQMWDDHNMIILITWKDDNA